MPSFDQSADEIRTPAEEVMEEEESKLINLKSPSRRRVAPTQANPLELERPPSDARNET